MFGSLSDNKEIRKILTLVFLIIFALVCSLISNSLASSNEFKLISQSGRVRLNGEPIRSKNLGQSASRKNFQAFEFSVDRDSHLLLKMGAVVVEAAPGTQFKLARHSFVLFSGSLKFDAIAGALGTHKELRINEVEVIYDTSFDHQWVVSAEEKESAFMARVNHPIQFALPEHGAGSNRRVGGAPSWIQFISVIGTVSLKKAGVTVGTHHLKQKRSLAGHSDAKREQSVDLNQIELREGEWTRGLRSVISQVWPKSLRADQTNHLLKDLGFQVAPALNHSP